MVTFPSMIQSPLQALLRPGMWLPGARNLHSHKVTWQSDKPPLEVLNALVSAIEQIKQNDDTGQFYDIHKVNKEQLFLRVFCFTRAEWLDVVEIKVKEDSIEAKSFSSGVLPLFIPFAFILNCVFFWVPFWDHKFNQARLELIKHYTDIAITGQQHITDGHHSTDDNEQTPEPNTQNRNTVPAEITTRSNITDGTERNDFCSDVVIDTSIRPITDELSRNILIDTNICPVTDEPSRDILIDTNIRPVTDEPSRDILIDTSIRPVTDETSTDILIGTNIRQVTDESSTNIVINTGIHPVTDGTVLNFPDADVSVHDIDASIRPAPEEPNAN